MTTFAVPVLRMEDRQGRRRLEPEFLRPAIPSNSLRLVAGNYLGRFPPASLLTVHDSPLPTGRRILVLKHPLYPEQRQMRAGSAAPILL